MTVMCCVHSAIVMRAIRSFLLRSGDVRFYLPMKCFIGMLSGTKAVNDCSGGESERAFLDDVLFQLVKGSWLLHDNW